jgi:GntR family transcriptional regulator, transcriptional repressor for pyruvate dehydrogenase complex
VSIPQSKVYIETIKQIQKIIYNDSLQPGDKIPSERELSDRLKVGRSSVREALRALELLGLIETRRGEGTFVKDFGGHQLVELIGSFILQDEKAKVDLNETKLLIEEQAIMLACKRITEAEIQQLKALVKEKDQSFHTKFIKTILLSSKNRLLVKIWGLLSEYMSAITKEDPVEEQIIYEDLIQLIQDGNDEKAIYLFRTLNS